MSIIIHFGPAFHPSPMIPSAALDSHSANATMGPGLENGSGFMMSADDSSVVDISTTSQIYPEKENTFISTPQHSFGTCFGLPYQDHNYGAPPPPTPPFSTPQLSPEHVPTVVEPETVSITTTVPSSEEVHETSVTRCICGFEHDDEYMICCDNCLVWQHVDCMGLNRSSIPETYLCEKCEPRKVDRHKAKLLQAKKKVVLPEKLVFTETSEESEEDKCNQNPDAAKSRLQRSATKKKLEDKELSPTKRHRKSPARLSQHGKERMEIKRSKLYRRTKSRSDSTSAATLDEEIAQDAWKCSIEWPHKRSDNNPPDNQYSDEVHHITGALKTEDEDAKVREQLQVQLCKVVEFGNFSKKLVAACDIMRDQMIIEYKGQFTSSSLFYEKHPAFKQKFFPYVLFYKLRSNEELCVDATDYKTDAKYIRRSCQPNAEVHHFVINGTLHLHILSTVDIRKDEEITIPFDVSYSEGAQELCACNSDRCKFGGESKSLEVSERKRPKRRMLTSTDDDSNHSVVMSSPSKSIKSPSTKSTSPHKPNISPSTSSSDQVTLLEDPDNDEQSREHKKKLTREERKLDAIMRAFDQMEKAAKRRQQALDRMAQQKALNPKQDDTPEKVETPTTKDEESSSSITNTTTTVTTTTATTMPPTGTSSVSTPSVATTVEQSTTSVEDEKSNSSSTKPKKGKRRRGSGASTRKRTRTNSGGSDIFTADESSACESSTRASTSTPTSDMSDAMSVTFLETAPSPVIPQLSSPTIFPKNKRFLHNEWLQERVESAPISSPSAWMPPPIPLIHREVRYTLLPATPTCYVRCTRDGPRPEGIPAAHLRRNSFGQAKVIFGLRSAKKRWLRQAMFDYYDPDYDDDASSVVDMNDDVAPLHNICYSPHPQIEAGSPGNVSLFDDVVPPLKKRRLMRRSVESLSSPKSPNADPTGASYAMSPDHSSCEPNADTSADGSTELVKNVDSTTSYATVKCEPSGNGLGKHLLKSLREKWIMNDNKAKESETPESEAHATTETASCAVVDNSEEAEVKCAEPAIVDKIKLDVPEQENKCNMETEDEDLKVEKPDATRESHSLTSVVDDVVEATENSDSTESVNKNSQLENCSTDISKEDLKHSTDSTADSNASANIEDSGEKIIKSIDAQMDGLSQESRLPVHMLNTSDDLVTSVGKVSGAVSVGIVCKLSVEERGISEASASPVTQRRKVSLSEYRQRKRDNPTFKQEKIDTKTSDIDSVKPPAEGTIKLSMLPLFENSEEPAIAEKDASGLKSSQSLDGLNHEKKSEQHRENLSDRLKREFGLEDADKNDGSKHSKVPRPLPRSSSTPSDISPILSLCTQLPPTPLSAPVTPVNPNGALTTRFTYPSSVQQPSYIGAQIPPNQFILHPPPGCMFGTRPPFPTPGSQSFSPLPQQMPHMSSPYPPQFQSTVYK